jgi:CRISPR/Cas system CSM-associated protein Csm3 (group 7 of RAMP superfamily)
VNAQWQNSRGLSERIVVTGALVLETPTHLGNGDADSPLDMPLILDPLERKALLTGASIAGALRSYLTEYSLSLADQLFGQPTDDASIQSPLIVDDAVGNSLKPDTELRDGVAIDPKTRGSGAVCEFCSSHFKDLKSKLTHYQKKFDIELLAAGTTFPLSFELLVLKDKEADLREALVLALQGLEKGEITLGKRKRRGFGRCRVSRWAVCRYDMTNPKGLIAWLDNDQSARLEGENIAILLDTSVSGQRQWSECRLNGTFVIDGSLLIRSGFGESNAPDFVHLHSKRNGKEVPVLSGTSLAGALRARAQRIAMTLWKDEKAVKTFTDKLFGFRQEKKEDKTPPTASRLWVEEAVIEKPLELVQSRVKIDRFTGGSYPGALFNEQPVFGQKDTRVQIQLKLIEPTEAEVGLLLLLLKDLWTGDLPVGGESSVGRGRLKGEETRLTYKDETWAFTRREGDVVQVEGDKARLEQFVQAFVEWKSNGTSH